MQPNAGKPRNVEGRNIYLCSPEYMAEYAKRFIQAGARAVGGCCGTTPGHIRAIRAAVRALRPPPPAEVRILSAEEKERATVQPVPREGKSRLAASLARGEFVVSVEVVPPRGCDPRRR